MNERDAHDLVDAWSRMRAEMDGVAAAAEAGTVTRAEVLRMEALFEDFAGVIRVSLGTEQIGEAIADSWSDLR
jgi:hypothetical protein